MLVTLEGLDGSGKTTVWGALQDRYPGAVFTREPTSDSWYGDAVYRSIEDDDADSLAELFLYTADHADHLTRTVEPALERGDLVISDRYADSRFAYQGATLAAYDRLEVPDPLEYVVAVHEPFTIEPDLTIYLDVDPETAADRAGTTNKFERRAYLERVHENYERLLERHPDRFVRIDASQEPEDVLEEVGEVLSEAIGSE
ncbi:dTMP kinase [Natronobacterium gregoryi]|uniref:Probable thymidylate kinase n=2 Tax=Natronobacterium gregoryi TaxID=44930 RepID=L0AKW9_NATGS|nr:dTMP kinase [Natronobacterium gregoryi]AFZ73827.1 thymidylate kinase [Natronobacterium gregoryi SP2]ELY65074.1 thymidylate kinase [Natronobacterium gregoryi SP2]PLK19715.1 dTMP kinase [Natronobacterium gregoryi SP2]SFJ41934.1 dTMP kinase [Natronobacterium gregoryi]